MNARATNHENQQNVRYLSLEENLNEQNQIF